MRHNPPRRNPLALLVPVALIVLSACGGGGGGASGGGSGAGRPSSSATLSIVEPANQETVPPGKLTVKLDLQGARIVEETTTDLEPDEGHIHLSLDDELLSMTYGLVQEVEVDPGVHVLVAEFVASDHAPFNPRVIVRRTFAVSPG